MRKVYIDENTAIDVPPLMVCESMFFNPRKDGSTYRVASDDQFLVDEEGTLGWISPKDTEVGELFRELVLVRNDIITISTPMKYLFDKEGIFSLSGYFNWSAIGMGFGQMSFSLKDGEVYFDTECMGPETTRKMLHDFVDFIVDNGKSEDWDRIADNQTAAASADQ